MSPISALHARIAVPSIGVHGRGVLIGFPAFLESGLRG